MATSVKLDETLKERVRELARLRDRSPHWVMREAIRQYVDREEVREDFYREAVESWKDYQETGQHLTGDEVARWLESWGKDDEAGMPDCHG